MMSLRLSVSLLLLVFASFSGIFVVPIHATTTVTNYASGNYVNECVLSTNSVHTDDGQHADGGGGFAETSYGTCSASGVTSPSNGVAVLQTVTRGSVGVSYHANSTIWFTDKLYAVPNVGQDHSWFNFSGLVYLLGYEAADGGGLGYYDSRIGLQVFTKIIRDDGKIYGPFAASITGTNAGGNGCSGSACEASNTSAGIAGLVHSAGWQSFAGTYAVSGTIRLDNGDLGHSYQASLYFEQTAYSQAAFATTTGAGGCLEYYKFVSSSFTKGVYDCTTVPVDVNGGNLPQAPNSGGGCPTGSLPHGGSQCFYAQWQFTNYQIGNYFLGDPDFNISSGNNSPPITQIFLDGSASQVNVYLTSIGGWSGTVSLTTSITAPSQSIYGKSQTPIVSLSSPSVFMPAGGSSQITLTVNSSIANTEPGPYTVAVTGTSGSLQHTTYFDFYIVYEDIVLTSLTPMQSGFQGHLGLNATIVNGGNWYYPGYFIGPGSIYTISFYANGTLFSTISWPSYGSNCVYFLGHILWCYGIPAGYTVSLLTDWNTNGWTPGTYSISAFVQPSGGDMAWQNNIAFIGSTVISQTMSLGGVTAKVNSVFAGSFPVTNALYGGTTITETNSTSGVNILSSQSPMTLSSPDNVNSRFVAQTANSPFWLAVICTIKTNSPSSSCSFGKTPDVDYDGSSSVDIGDIATAAIAFGSNSSSYNWNPKADVTGDGKVDIQDLATIALYFGWPIFQMTPSIVSISPSPAFLVFQAGSSNSTTMSATSQNRWSGTLTLSSSTAPSGPSCLFGFSSSTSLSLGAGTTGAKTLTCSAGGSVTPGIYSGTVAGSASGLGNSATFPLYVSGFSITATGPVSFIAGSTGSSTITLTSLFGFAGAVTLPPPTVSPSTGLSVSCPSSVSLSENGQTTAACTFSSTTPGIYAVTITGQSGSFSRTATVTVNVRDFSLSASPSNFCCAVRGWSVSTTMNLTSIAGFSGNVTLTVTSIDSFNLCASWSLPYTNCNTGSTTVSLAPNGSGSAILYIGTYTNSIKTTYDVVVTATSGSLSHTTTIILTLIR